MDEIGFISGGALVSLQDYKMVTTGWTLPLPLLLLQAAKRWHHRPANSFH